MKDLLKQIKKSFPQGSESSVRSSGLRPEQVKKEKKTQDATRRISKGP